MRILLSLLHKHAHTHTLSSSMHLPARTYLCAPVHRWTPPIQSGKLWRCHCLPPSSQDPSSGPTEPPDPSAPVEEKKKLQWETAFLFRKTDRVTAALCPVWTVSSDYKTLTSHRTLLAPTLDLYYPLLWQQQHRAPFTQLRFHVLETTGHFLPIGQKWIQTPWLWILDSDWSERCYINTQFPTNSSPAASRRFYSNSLFTLKDVYNCYELVKSNWLYRC